MKPTCKICQAPVHPKHHIDNITYYFCPKCEFLQNYYWEENPNPKENQTKVNNERRADRWPAGEKDYMHKEGWKYLEQMVWPVAWYAGKIHRFLKKIPAYNQVAHSYIRRKLPKTMDFGCGHGISAIELHERDHLDVIGLDPFSPTQHPRILTQEVKEVNFSSDTFDGIFAIETMEHIPNILEVFSELNRITKPGGILLVQTSRLEHPQYVKEKENWFYLEHPQTHVSIYSRPAMRTIAQKTGWRSVQFHGPRLAKFIK